MNKYNISEAKVLIVDDQQENTKLVEFMLKRYGYINLKSINDSRLFKETFLEYNPDVILLDLLMPFLNGIQILQEMNKMNISEYIPVLIITGTEDRDLKITALQEGATDFIEKPMDEIEVITRIQNYLQMRFLNKQIMDHNKALEIKIKERTKELERIQYEIINRLGRAVEYRDNETGVHVTRMSLYCEVVAKGMNLSERDCKLLLYASKLHDIGKIAIPDSILLKTGKLTNEEFNEMKEHTNIGGEILSGSNYEILDIAHEIATTHHEKWDGTGYPLGLKGEQIPLVGRIAAICDVFDALTSERPYKRAWTVEEAVEEILKQKGKHFDPTVCDVFMTKLNEIIKIKTTYSDVHHT